MTNVLHIVSEEASFNMKPKMEPISFDIKKVLMVWHIVRSEGP